MLLISTSEDEFVIEGHAHYAQEGQDIVCSAVSFLAQSVANALPLYAHTSQKEHKGYMHVLCLTQSAESIALMRMFRENIKLLSVQFPEYVKLVEK